MKTWWGLACWAWYAQWIASTTRATWAITLIRGAILQELRDWDWAPRLERERAKAGQVEILHPVSVEERVKGSPELRLLDTVQDEAPGPEEVAEAADRDRRLLELVRKLPDREVEVIYRYYWEGETFKAIGKALGVSESRALQLQQQAMVRLRQWTDEEGAW